MPVFPDKFLKGIALSVYQNSGDDNGQWTEFATSKSWLGQPRIAGKYNIDTNSNFWDRYVDDIPLAKSLGANALRFSLEWSRIMPLARGIVDVAAINRYNEMLDVMEAQGLEPMATLHHFVHPQWFEDIGAFTKSENCVIFAEYCEMAFKLFGKRVKLWATFNEPTVVAFCGWMVGIHPPGHVWSPTVGGQVMCNLMQAHTLAYEAIKAQPGGSDAAVGIVHHHVQFDSVGEGWKYYGAKTVCWWMTHWFGWDSVINYFKTGKYEWRVPFGAPVRYEHPTGRPPCDWWGINYYTRFLLDWNLKFVGMPDDIMTDMNTPVYPEGMYKALMHANTLGLPMYITETGMSDGADTRRPHLITQYWQAEERAIRDGADLRGQFYWTLLDNFEWHEGYTLQYGLHAWSPTGEPDRVPRLSAHVLASIYNNTPDGLNQVRSTLRVPDATFAAAAVLMALEEASLKDLPSIGQSETSCSTNWSFTRKNRSSNQVAPIPESDNLKPVAGKSTSSSTVHNSSSSEPAFLPVLDVDGADLDPCASQDSSEVTNGSVGGTPKAVPKVAA